MIRSLVSFFWALVGGLVVLYIFFAAIGGVDPVQSRGVTLIVLALAVGWLVHYCIQAIRARNLSGEMRARERERRGF